MNRVFLRLRRLKRWKVFPLVRPGYTGSFFQVPSSIVLEFGTSTSANHLYMGFRCRGVKIPSSSRNLSSAQLCYVLISTSTPAGRLRLIRESMVFSVGSAISIKRLWIRISYWSRESLCTKVDRFTVYFRFSVGSGTGPRTFAPDRSVVWMIVWVA